MDTRQCSCCRCNRNYDCFIKDNKVLKTCIICRTWQKNNWRSYAATHREQLREHKKKWRDKVRLTA